MNRRRFAGIASGGLVGCPEAFVPVADVAPRSVRVGAIQMTAELANIDVNLLKAERLTPSVNTAKPAMREHFKTGQVSRAQDLQLF